MPGTGEVPEKHSFAPTLGPHSPLATVAPALQNRHRMGTRALAVLLLAPSIALAQTAGQLIPDPTEVGQATCTNENVLLTWLINTTNTGGSAVVNSDRYRVAVYASTEACPQAASAPAAGAANVVVDDVLAIGDTDSETVTSGAIATAGGVTCVSGNVSASDVSKKLCVYLVDTNGVRGTDGRAAEGTFKFQLARPPPPVLESVEDASESLIVRFHAGTASGSDTATSDRFEVRVYLGSTLVSTASNAVSGVRVGGLVNSQPPTTYTVRVVAFSSAGNESGPSNVLTGTPKDFVDFWRAYQDAGGQEQGGCGGGAGALSSLALLPLALRRRRP